MSVLYSYFLARSDAAAAAMLDQPGSPGGPDGTALVDGVMPLDTNGIDPLAILGQLEALLTGTSWDAILAREPGVRLIATTDGNSVVVHAMPAEFQRALAAASEDELMAVVEPWSEIEEFGGGADLTDLEQILFDLADLAKIAEKTERAMYCWSCL